MIRPRGLPLSTASLSRPGPSSGVSRAGGVGEDVGNAALCPRDGSVGTVAGMAAQLDDLEGLFQQ